MNAELIPAQESTNAIVVAEYSETEAALAQLRQKHENVVFDLTTTKGDKEARAVRQELVRLRTGLDKLRLKLNADDRERIERRNSEAKRITTAIEALESPIDQQIKAEETRKEQERQAKIEAEQRRVTALQQRVTELRGNQMLTPTSGAELIAQHIGDLEAIAIDDSFQEYREQAEGAKAKGLERLGGLHTAALAYEAEQKRLADERAHLALQKRADDEIRAIQQLQVNADRRGTLDGYDEAIRTAQVWKIDDAFGVHAASIADALNDTRALLLDRREALAKKIAIEEEERATAARERARIEEENRQAQLRRQAEEAEHQATLRRQREQSEAEDAERRRILREQEEAASLAQSRMSEIQGIQQQVIIASCGRAGVREGGTVECIRETLAETEAWAVTEENFGPMLMIAQSAKELALRDIRKLLADAETQEALRVQQEAMTKPSDPVEATSAESVQSTSDEQTIVTYRPTDDEIIEAVAQAFFVPESTAVDWIAGMAICQRAA